MMDFFGDYDIDGYLSKVLSERGDGQILQKSPNIGLEAEEIQVEKHLEGGALNLSPGLTERLGFLDEQYLLSANAVNDAMLEDPVSELNTALSKVLHASNLNRDVIDAFSARLRVLDNILEGRKHIKVRRLALFLIPGGLLLD